ncbi:MAG TPA: HAD family phosphatase [Bryobacteraceae bacterium]|nr:HAD family phosphatase [Bryobacteraceae bacterium]
MAAVPLAERALMHRAAIFDLGRVLVNFDFGRGYRAMESLCPYSAEEISKRVAATSLAVDFETGLMEPRDFVAGMARVLDCHIEYGRFCEIWSSIFTETLVPESLLRNLAARYRLLMLSNTNAIHFQMIRETYPLVRHFHEFILSYEVKAMKPRREIFERAIERAGCPAEECFYTDDIAEYVEAARRLGIDAVQFRSAAQLEDELRARGMV